MCVRVYCIMNYGDEDEQRKARKKEVEINKFAERREKRKEIRVPEKEKEQQQKKKVTQQL